MPTALSDPQPYRDRAQRLLVLALLVAAAAAGLAALMQRQQPQALLEVGDARLPCVSYAPFRRAGHNPFDAGLRVSPQQIEADLRLLAGVTRCVRTYGLDHGLDAVPGIARRLGLRVVLGAWIGRDAAANEDQLTRALALARAHADVIELLIVGNEVLLRRELTPQALAALLARARRDSPVPVAYADVWEFWLRHGEHLRPHVDRVAVHVLPFWEDHPVANAEAAPYVVALAGRLRVAFAPLPVWVAETGWPAEGRQRGPAVPGRAEQARFVREMLAREAAAGPAALGFNLIEGFDQPWKRQLEGAMGGYWGLFDADGQLRVPMTGALPGEPEAAQALWAAALGAVLGALGAAWLGRRAGRAGRWPGHGAARAAPMVWTPWLVTWALGAAALGACLTLQWQAERVWSRTAWETVTGLIPAALAAGAALMELPHLARRLAGGSAAMPRLGCVAAWRGRGPWHERARAGLLAALLFCAALAALQLLFDGRYRPLLWPAAWAPAASVLALALLGERLAPAAREERLLAAICAAAALSLLWLEGVFNGQALATAATWLALATVAWPHRIGPAGKTDRPGRTHTRADSSTAAAAGPAE